MKNIKTFSLSSARNVAESVAGKPLTMWNDGETIVISTGEGATGYSLALQIVDRCDLPGVIQASPITGSFMKFKSTITQIKVAWIRNADVPPGQPASGRLNCPCKAAPLSLFHPSFGNIRCDCGKLYTWDGYLAS